MFKKNKEKKQSRFFRKSEDGRDIFYPWGYPGEGFYVDKKIKKKVIIFLYLIGLIFVVSFLNPFYSAKEYHIELYSAFCISTAVLTIFPLLYYAYVRRLVKKLEPIRVIEKTIPTDLLFTLLRLLFLQILFTAIGLYAGHPHLGNLPLLTLNGTYIALVTAAAIITFKKKGYFLTKTI